ncbi:hypothetical protein HDV05_007784 [Chytridiales sp. JEL 0842]|nr:hypothetical protein HDV05_007784 [Chytridiales sp. JEL 0842]
MVNSDGEEIVEEEEEEESMLVSWSRPLLKSLQVVGRFVNPWPEWEDRNTGDFGAVIWWQLTRECRNGVPRDQKTIDNTLPVIKPDFDIWNRFHETCQAALINKVPNPPLLSVTWFGQSTCFIQMDGYNILTDPIFSQRTVGDWFGPRRIQRVPCQLEDLPKVDIVLVSHNHFDHLDRAVVNKLKNSVTWYVPLGLKPWFASYGVTNVIELDWWQEHIHDSPPSSSSSLPPLKIIGTPIQHWSGRSFFDINASLWCSFVVKGPRASVYHCGDTGYCSVFKEIGDRYGPITLSAIPIGSYEPRSHMRHQHVDPSEAVQIHLDTRSQKSIGVHWGTFMMSDEHYLDPPKELEKASREKGVGEGEIGVLRMGEVVVLKEGVEGF